jgi:hypothetical protein
MGMLARHFGYEEAAEADRRGAARGAVVARLGRRHLNGIQAALN